MSATPPLPVLLLLDVEPRGRFLDRNNPGPWEGFPEAVAILDELRPRLRGPDGAPARFCWFLRFDPQISLSYGHADAVVRDHPYLFRRLADADDLFGLHTHCYRPQEDGGWVIDHGNPAWVDECLDQSFATYREVFGRDAEDFRFGDRFMSDAAQRKFESLGLRHNLSIEPGMPPLPSMVKGDRVTGSLPDWRGLPYEPWKPALADYHRADPVRAEAPWMIPSSTARYPASFQVFVQATRIARGLRPQPAGYRTLMPPHRPAAFRHLVRRCLRRGDRYLALVLRLPVMTGEREARQFRENLLGLGSLVGERGVVFTSPADLLVRLGLEPAA